MMPTVSRPQGIASLSYSQSKVIELKAAPIGVANNEAVDLPYKNRSRVEISHKEVAALRSRVRWIANRRSQRQAGERQRVLSIARERPSSSSLARPVQE
jgi:hypothetical protein